MGQCLSCGSSKPVDGSASSGGSCPTLKGTSWVPQVSGVTPSNHDSSVTLSESVVQTSGPITGLAQAAPSSREVQVTIDMTQDLGASGSLTLIGQVTQYPSSLSGNAFAYLVSLNDGTNEYINLTRSGSGGDCAASGYYTCSGGTCTANSSCSVTWPSAYFNRTHWEERQGISNSAINLPSINVFPTCNWSGGSGQSVSDPTCAFNSNFFPGGISPARLRYGVNYTARYLLLADRYASLSGQTANLKITAIKKTSTRTSPGGAFDINLILVGSNNIKASRTAKGQQNLNTLAAQISDYYSQASTNLKLGAVHAIEWPCDSGGDQYSTTSVSELPELFSASSLLVPSSYEKTAANVFLVSAIEDDSDGANSNLTILGIDGAIPGPLVNGTASSGMVISTFDALDTYNSNCSSSQASCPLTQQDSSFFQLGTTVAHELGHYFGLNHLSEATGTSHDFVLDTPICTATTNVGGSQYITNTSCRVSDTHVFSGTGTTCSTSCPTYSSSSGLFCASALACEFNYMMWWTGKNFHASTGGSDGTLFSSYEGAIINYHPLVQ